MGADCAGDQLIACAGDTGTSTRTPENIEFAGGPSFCTPHVSAD